LTLSVIADRPATVQPDGANRVQEDTAQAEIRHHADFGGSGWTRSSLAEPDRRARILVVDDNDVLRETLAELLDIGGFCAVQAADAAQALMILRQPDAIDVLVTDLSMPGASGIQLIHLAREIKRDLPAILLTGYAEDAKAVTGDADGQYYVLRKPVDSDRLIEQVERLVVCSQASRAMA